jgi:hypothetical protein
LVSSDTFLRHDDMIEGFGLTIGEIRAVARRQFVGSVVVAFLVVTVAGFVALWLCTPPMLRDYATAHKGRTAAGLRDVVRPLDRDYKARDRSSVVRERWAVPPIRIAEAPEGALLAALFLCLQSRSPRSFMGLGLARCSPLRAGPGRPRLESPGPQVGPARKYRGADFV